MSEIPRSSRAIHTIALMILAPALGCQSGPSLSDSSKPTSGPAVSFEERLLATIPEELEDCVQTSYRAILFSPDGRTVAYVVQLTGELNESPRCYVMVGGRREPEVGRVGELRGTCSFSGGAPVFAAKGGRFGYAFRLGNMDKGVEGVMVDGKMGPLFDQVSDPRFTPDGIRFCYEAVEKDKAFVVFDHEPAGRDYDNADLPRFSPDGVRSGYRGTLYGAPDEEGARPIRAQFIVVDGVKGDEFDFVGIPVFHPVSGEVAFCAKKDGKYRMVGAAQLARSYDYLGDPVFSVDGRRMACVAGAGGRFFILVDGQEQVTPFASVGDPFFSPDGRHVAYLGIRDADEGYAEYPPIPKSDGRKCMVVDGEAGEDGQFIWEPRFAPDNRRLIYQLHQKEEESVVYGREKFGGEFAGVEDPAVSPDGKRVAFVATIPDVGDVVVSGDQRSEPFDYVRSPVFSPDGKKIAFGARKGNELWWKVMEVK